MLLDRRQRAPLPLGKRRLGQAPIAPPETGEPLEYFLDRFLGARYQRQVATERIGFADGVDRHRRHIGDEPVIEIPVEVFRRKNIDLARQHQRRVVARRLDELLFAEPHALPPAQAMA
ncbi:hypothetical protein D9M72_448480 [compost metagenome]